MALTGCGNDSEPTATDGTPQVSATESAPVTESGGSDQTTGSPGATDTAGGSETSSAVDCSGRECSVTLTGDGAEADVLGTSIVLGTVQDGRATFRIGDRDVSCGQGESVSAGPLTLACSTITDDEVTLTASLG